MQIYVKRCCLKAIAKGLGCFESRGNNVLIQSKPKIRQEDKFMPCTKHMTGITVSIRVETESTVFSCNVQDANKITTHFEALFKNFLRYVKMIMWIAQIR